MFPTFSSRRANTEAVTEDLLKLLKVPVHRSTITKNLQEHPEYPSLLAISECLSEWKIPSSSYFIKKEDYDPSELKFPALAHSKVMGKFMLVQGMSDGMVTIQDEIKKERITEKEFLHRWDGVLLYAEPTPASGTQNYREEKNNGHFKQPEDTGSFVHSLHFNNFGWQQCRPYALVIGGFPVKNHRTCCFCAFADEQY